jgi:hypothetical protein
MGGGGSRNRDRIAAVRLQTTGCGRSGEEAPAHGRWGGEGGRHKDRADRHSRPNRAGCGVAARLSRGDNVRTLLIVRIHKVYLDRLLAGSGQLRNRVGAMSCSCAA